MICPECGKEIEDDVLICPFCNIPMELFNEYPIKSSITDKKVEGINDSTTTYPTNNVAAILKFVGIVAVVMGFINGCVIGQDQRGDLNVADALLYWCIGIVSGVLLYGFGEVISLLQQLVNKNK